APPRASLTRLAEDPGVLDRLEAALPGWKERLAPLGPEGAVETDRLTPEHLFYFACQDQVRRLEARLRAVRGRLRPASAAGERRHLAPRPGAGKRRAPLLSWIGVERCADLMSRPDLRTPLRELGEEVSPRTDLEERAELLSLLVSAAMLQQLLQKGPGPEELPDPIAFSEDPHHLARDLLAAYAEALRSQELEARVQGLRLTAAGPGAGALLAGERGVHLFVDPHGEGLVPLIAGDRGVVRLYAPTCSLDLTTGLIVVGRFRPEHALWFLEAGLPLVL
ncbi:MAG: hypothetical protein AB1758_21930, partial [Candidatus Eremiobacterota bacterium]